MTYVENLLATAFSADAAENEAEQRAFLARIASNPDSRQRDGLHRELELALADPTYDWESLLDTHDVYHEGDAGARRFVIDRIWTPLFGRDHD